MQIKEKNDKTICLENKIEQVIPVPAIAIAEIADVSESLVKKIDNGLRNADTKKGKKVIVARQLMCAAIAQAQIEVKKVISEL